MLNVFDNSLILKNEKLPIKYLIFISIIFISFIFVSIILFKIKYNDSYITNSYFQNNKLTFNITSNTLKDLKNLNKVTINENDYDYQILSLSEPILDTNNNIYYEIKIKVFDNNFYENEVLKLIFNFQKTNMFFELFRIIKEV